MGVTEESESLNTESRGVKRTATELIEGVDLLNEFYDPEQSLLRNLERAMYEDGNEIDDLDNEDQKIMTGRYCTDCGHSLITCECFDFWTDKHCPFCSGDKYDEGDDTCCDCSYLLKESMDEKKFSWEAVTCKIDSKTNALILDTEAEELGEEWEDYMCMNKHYQFESVELFKFKRHLTKYMNSREQKFHQQGTPEDQWPELYKQYKHETRQEMQSLLKQFKGEFNNEGKEAEEIVHDISDECLEFHRRVARVYTFDQAPFILQLEVPATAIRLNPRQSMWLVLNDKNDIIPTTCENYYKITEPKDKVLTFLKNTRQRWEEIKKSL